MCVCFDIWRCKKRSYLFCKVNENKFSRFFFVNRLEALFAVGVVVVVVVVVGWELLLSLVGVNILFANGATIICRLVMLTYYASKWI